MVRNERIEYIDGIRGIASILVVFCHLSLVFVPWLYDINQAKTKFDFLFLNSPLNILTNGSFPVTVFFFISGYLITRKNYCRNNAEVRATPQFVYLKYLKLVIPAVLFPAILMTVGGMFHLQAVEMDASLHAVESYNNFTPSVIGVIIDITKETFVSYSRYNGPLWTIKYEFLGSLILTAFSFYLSKIRGVCSTISFLFLMLLAVYWDITFLPFFIGGGLYDIESHLRYEKIFFFRIPIFALGTYLACVNLSGSGIYSVFSGRPAVMSICRGSGIAMCFFVINNSVACKRFLSAKSLAFLGRISPWMYIFHWPIILSVGCWSFIHLMYKINRTLVILMISLLVIAVSIVVAYLAYIVDQKLMLHMRKGVGK